MVPVVDFCGLRLSRLIIGGNPFSGFSHQSSKRDQEMLDYYTTATLKDTLYKAEANGINTTIMRSDTHIQRLLREYWNEGGKLQWIAQVGADSEASSINRAMDVAVAHGASAAYIHGGIVDRFYAENNADGLAAVIEHTKSLGIPAGVAGHAPQAHLWAYERDLGIDFHVVCFYNCGSLHAGAGDKFDPADPPVAVQAIQTIQKPCIGYKIMGAGRVEAQKGFKFAFDNIKPGDCVNVGMYLGDNQNMVEDNVRMVSEVCNA